MIIYVKGDLFKAPQDILAHGCNCLGGYGSGVAGLMAKIHPSSKEAYLKKHQSSGWKLGDVQYVKSNDKIIANCATQYAYGSPKSGTIFCDYSAIEKVMINLKNIADTKKMSIAIPKIGAGLAGGDWNKIESIINSIFKDTEIFVYVL